MQRGTLKVMYDFRCALGSLTGAAISLLMVSAVVALSVACHTGLPSALSDLKMGDPRSEQQLIAGFWAIEQGKWRWTARRFAVVLLPPHGSQQNGATLELKVFIPSQQIEKLGVLTLNASVGDMSLAPEEFTVGGACTYIRDIPPALIGSNMLPIVFNLDKAMTPANTDGRELGIIVAEVALEPKNVSRAR